MGETPSDEGECCLVRKVGLTWGDGRQVPSYGEVRVTSTYFIWNPHTQMKDQTTRHIPLQSIVAVDKETRGLLKKKHILKVAIRVDSNQEPTVDVLRVHAIQSMNLYVDDDSEKLLSLYHYLNMVLLQEPKDLGAVTHMQDADDHEQITDGRISQMMELGFEDRIVQAALDACEPGATAEQLTSWILDHEVSLRLQLEYDSEFFRIGQGGIRNVFSREYKKLLNNFDAVQQGLASQESLNALTKDLDRVAHEIFDRKRLNGESEDDIMEDMLYKSMIRHDLIGCVSEGDVPRDVYIKELARQIGHVLLACSRSSYGVISVSEAYRIYNRSRFKSVVGPRDFMDACSCFESVSVPLTFAKDSNAIFSKEHSMDEFRQKILTCVFHGHGVSRVHVATKTGMPIGIVKHYLDEAERAHLVARDEKSPHGLSYYKNMFDQFS